MAFLTGRQALTTRAVADQLVEAAARPVDDCHVKLGPPVSRPRCTHDVPPDDQNGRDQIAAQPPGRRARPC